MKTTGKSLVVGVDPGSLSGALVIMSMSAKLRAITRMPNYKIKAVTKGAKTKTHLDLHKICRFLDKYIGKDDEVCLAIEDVGLLPPTFGIQASVSLVSAKIAIMAIGVARGYRVMTVPAKEWQREFFNYSSRTKHDKENSIRLAKQLFPECAPVIDQKKAGQSDIAEAILIGEYARRRIR